MNNFDVPLPMRKRIKDGENVDAYDLVAAWREITPCATEWIGDDPELVLTERGWIVRITVANNYRKTIRGQYGEPWLAAEDAIEALWKMIDDARRAAVQRDLFEKE